MQSTLPNTASPSECCAAAREFLTARIVAGSYDLACTASDGSPCPVHETGHVFSGFFVIDALQAAGEVPSTVAELVTARIAAEDRGNVWGYCREAPVDADDTAFTLRTLALLGRPAPLDGLMRFYRPRAGVFTTFQGNSSGRLSFVPSFRNNAEVHPEVGANIYSLLWQRDEHGCINVPLVRAAQSEDGSWPSYFYPSRYYATRFFLELMQRSGMLPVSRSAGLEYLRKTQNADGSWGEPGNAYETALALSGLASSGTVERGIAAGARFLMECQLSDGSWPCDRVVWQYCLDDTVVWFAYDTNRVVTTALALSALTQARP